MVKKTSTVLGAIALLAASALPALAQQSLTWTAGAVGGGWYTISGGMAELMREKAGLNIKVVPGGGTQNPVLVQKGEAEIGMGLPPLLGAAFRGEDPYPGQKMAELRAVAGNMSLNTFHFYVAADSPVRQDDDGGDLQGQEAHPPCHLQARLLRRVGVREGDGVLRLLLGRQDRGLLQDLGGGGRQVLPRLLLGAGGRLQGPERGRDLHLPRAARRLHHRGLGGARSEDPRVPEAACSSTSASSGWARASIPAGTYPKAANGNEPVVSATMGTTITVSTTMSNDIAYTLAKTLNDNADRVRKIHGSLADYEPSKGHLFLGVALHPGAERYYKEKGWLK